MIYRVDPYTDNKVNDNYRYITRKLPSNFDGMIQLKVFSLNSGELKASKAIWQNRATYIQIQKGQIEVLQD